MTTVSAQKRDGNTKAKKLRREGFVPGVVCGREVKEKFLIQIPEKEAMSLIHKNQKGEQVVLQVGDQKIHAIIKDYTYNALKKQLEVLDFQQLVNGEKIHTTVEVLLKNEMLANGVVTQELSEIPYKADPEHLLDTIVLDFEKIDKTVKTMRVGDLEQFKNPAISVSNPDAIIYSVTIPDALPEDEEDAETAATTQA